MSKQDAKSASKMQLPRLGIQSTTAGMHQHRPGKPFGQKPSMPQPQEAPQPNLFLYFGEDFEPFHDLVLVQCQFLEEATGVVVPDSVKERQMTAKVMKVGPGRVTESGAVRNPPCQSGDWVFAMIGKGIPIKLGDKAMTLLNSSDVLGKFPEGPKRPEVKEMHSDMGVKMCQCGNPEDEGMIHRTDMPCFPKAKAE